MDYRKVISNAVPEFVFNDKKIKTTPESAEYDKSENKDYNVFDSVFNPNIFKVTPKITLKYYYGKLLITPKNELNNLVVKIQELILNENDFTVYEIAFTMKELVNNSKFESAFKFLENKLISDIPTVGFSEIKKSLKSSMRILIQDAKNRKSEIPAEDLTEMIDTASLSNILYLIKGFEKKEYKIDNELIYSVIAFIPILEEINNQTKSTHENQKSEFNKLTLEIKQKTIEANQKKLEARVATLQEEVNNLKTQNQLLLKQQEIANKIIN